MTGYNPKDAEGFINLFALPITVPQDAHAKARRGNAMSGPEDQKMWGGRFDRAPDASFYEFERSWRFDRRLLPQEFALDRAWARAIAAAGILTDAEGQQDRRRTRRNGTPRANPTPPGSTIRKPKTFTISSKPR